MAILKCKMCGGTIEFNPGDTIGTCDSCGTKQTLPRIDDDKKANLYDRANHFRRNNDFDKAMGIYEQILNEDNTDAESYWSLVLCRYGIEYVEDPTNHKRVPTVNRAQFTSIYMDEDYKSALKYADIYQRAIYEEEAKAIDDIQKGILEISSKEEPFDVFICYKETDNSGRRTPDSVLATELYHQLIQEGFKVFFSRITLEDKLGIAYEPYIFAALNSAKVMVAIGTKPEYFNAVWVKNEWSRYLALVKKSGGKKMLIPAYRDMDPYDLPEEFSHLQAQDMSKLGFMQDLIRGIKKIISADAPKETVKETVVVNSNNASVAPLLERVFLFLEDGKWQDANIYCEKVLDIDPKNAEAYLGKLMAELRVSNRSDLKHCAKPFDELDNYSKVIRFGNEALESEMRGYIKYINDRNENERKAGIYEDAVLSMKMANTEDACYAAAETFKSIGDFKDAAELVNQCLEKAEKCKRIRIAKEESDRVEAERKAEERRAAAERAKRRTKKIVSIVVPVVAICLVVAIVLTQVIIPKTQYSNAVKKYGQEWADTVKNASIGDEITIGSYEQDNNVSNGKEKIEWIVLDKKGMSVMLVSKYALDCQKYNATKESTSWEKCSLRTWLNDTFINNAFSSDEQSMIATTSVSADKNPKYSTNPGNATSDKVFLLSIAEAETYFAYDSARTCKPTAYAIANGAHVNKDNGNCWWWLRSPGDNRSRAATVNTFIGVIYDGLIAYNGGGCARPAMWISLE